MSTSIKERRFTTQRTGSPLDFEVYDHEEKRIAAVCRSWEDAARIAAALTEPEQGPQGIDQTIKNELGRRLKPLPEPITEDELMAYKALCAALMKIQRGGSQTLEDHFDKERASKAAPEQEPFAWLYKSVVVNDRQSDAFDTDEVREYVHQNKHHPDLAKHTPLYTSPQHNEWKELNEGEKIALCNEDEFDDMALIDRTCAALRAKNGGNNSRTNPQAKAA